MSEPAEAAPADLPPDPDGVPMTRADLAPVDPAHYADLGVPVYGLSDTREGGWMGTPVGPLLYRHLTVAQLAAQTVSCRMGWPSVRVRARLYDGGGLIERNPGRPVRSGEEALEQLESGRYL